MTEEQLALLRNVVELPRTIGPEPGEDRTLLYGYDCDRRTWHIYQKDGEIHRAIYITHNPKPEAYDHGPELDVEILVPNKRLYPEACDFEFCKKLKQLGAWLSFTTFGTLPNMEQRAPFVARTF